MVFLEKISTLLPIKAETPSLASPAVTNGNSPLIRSILFSLFPLVDRPYKSFKLNLDHVTFPKLDKAIFSSDVNS